MPEIPALHLSSSCHSCSTSNQFTVHSLVKKKKKKSRKWPKCLVPCYPDHYNHLESVWTKGWNISLSLPLSLSNSGFQINKCKMRLIPTSKDLGLSPGSTPHANFFLTYTLGDSSNGSNCWLPATHMGTRTYFLVLVLDLLNLVQTKQKLRVEKPGFCPCGTIWSKTYPATGQQEL